MQFASSGGTVYGEQQDFPAAEDHPVRPLSPYGIAKLCSEQYLYYYYMIHGISSVVFRYANVYGPRQSAEGEAGVVAVFASKLLKGEQPIINGDGKQTRDFVYVDDVVGASLTSINEMFRLISIETGSALSARHGPPKEGEQRRSVLDASRIGSELGWSPGMTLKEGLMKTVLSFRKSNVK
jgi:UDP-glucose 4-epimerase